MPSELTVPGAACVCEHGGLHQGCVSTTPRRRMRRPFRVAESADPQGAIGAHVPRAARLPWRSRPGNEVRRDRLGPPGFSGECGGDPEAELCTDLDEAPLAGAGR